MVLISLTIAIAVTCFALVQFGYLMFLQATVRQQRRRVAELERELGALQRARGASPAVGVEPDEAADEVWSELIDDGAG